MKRKITLLATVIMLSLYGCNSKTDRLLTSSNGEIVPDSVFTVSTTVDSSAFCPRLLEEIKAFIRQHGEPVIAMWIEDKGDDCFVFFTTALFYYSGYMCGYQIIDDRMVVYCFNTIDEIWCYYDFLEKCQTKDPSELLTESKCAELLIDKSKLITDLPKSYYEDPNGFADENSEFADYFYEPAGKRFKIHSADSLEVVFDGYY